MTTDDKTEKANTAIPTEAVHDRIQMASVNADGTLDQTNPVFIGDKETALAATKEQFKQQAVSAADEKNAVSGGTTVEDAPQDPAIEARQKEHEKVAAAAEKAATKVVNDLHEG
jgi:hypothetical protein